MARNLKDALIEMAAHRFIMGKINELRKGVSTMHFLTGYKTYIVAVILVILAALSAIGIPVPGFDMEPGAAVTMALGLVFSRNGAKTEAKKIGG